MDAGNSDDDRSWKTLIPWAHGHARRDDPRASEIEMRHANALTSPPHASSPNQQGYWLSQYMNMNVNFKKK